MTEKTFTISVGTVAGIFTLLFCILVLPPFVEQPNILEAFGAGFENPYASAYSTDVFCCFAVLLVWIIYESPKVKYGWVCLLLCLVPGVAVGFAIYLIMRTRQLSGGKTG
ncbi:MAG: DUF2834 domain-containing protein [Saprospiraceae bacterium]|nr:DUF2834 domain-containing protein [Saprospiraceae bacterium]